MSWFTHATGIDKLEDGGVKGIEYIKRVVAVEVKVKDDAISELQTMYHDLTTGNVADIPAQKAKFDATVEEAREAYEVDKQFLLEVQDVKAYIHAAEHGGDPNAPSRKLAQKFLEKYETGAGPGTGG